MIPVGPSDAEVAGLIDLTDSLRVFASNVSHLIIIDDGVTPRGLDDLIAWPGVDVVSLRTALSKKWVSVYAAQVAGTMIGLAYAAEQPDVAYVLKADTDTLAIRPFHDMILAKFQTDPLAGILGACDFTPGGVPCDYSAWAARVPRAGRALHFRRTVGRLPVRTYYVNMHRRRKIAGLLRLAEENGYERGRHCVGGAYALSDRALKRLRERGLLDDPLLWTGTGLGEDVVLGIAVSAVGLKMRDFVSDGEPFGVTLPGLPDTPQALLQRGFALVHSVKGDPISSESAIRAFYREVRAGRDPDGKA